MKTKTKIVISVLVLLALLAGMEVYMEKNDKSPAWARGKPATTIRGVPATDTDTDTGRQVQRRKGSVGAGQRNPFDALNDPMIDPSYNVTVPNFNTPQAFNRADASRRVATNEQTVALRNGERVNPNAGNSPALNWYLSLFNRAGGIGMPTSLGSNAIIPNVSYNAGDSGNENISSGQNTPDTGQIVVNGNAGTPRYGEDTRNLYQLLNAPLPGVLPPLTDQGSTGYQGGYGGRSGRRGFGTNYGWSNGSGYSGYPSWYQNLVNWNIK